MIEWLANTRLFDLICFHLELLIGIRPISPLR